MFSKNYYKNSTFSILTEFPYKFRETFDECYHILEKFLKKLKKWLLFRGNYWKWDENS